MLAPLLVLYFAAAAATPALPPGKGKAIVARTCVNCHALKVVTSKRATKEQWSALVDQMVSRGADLNDDEIDTVVNYLSKNFGLKGAPAVPAKKNFLPTQKMDSVNVNQASANELAATLHFSAEKCAAIVAYREKNGNYKDWRDLTNVPGIQAADIESRKDLLQF
jgi:competence protein ComEA